MRGDIIVAVVFPSRDVLTRALNRMAKFDYVDIRRAAVVAKAASGEIVILDDDINADQGGIAGGTLGAALSLLGMAHLGALALPGVGPIVALGAAALVGGLLGRATGRFAAQFVDLGFKHEQIEALADQLGAGRPALVLELKNGETTLDRLREDLKPFKAEVIAPVTLPEPVATV